MGNRRPISLTLLDPVLPGVFHGLEIPFVFGDDTLKLTAEEKKLSERMQTLWTNFAKHMDPTPGDRSAFPKYSNKKRESLVLQVPADEVEEDFRGDYCELWHQLVYRKFENAKADAPAAGKQ